MRFAFIATYALSLAPLFANGALVKRALTTCGMFTNVELITPATADRPAMNFGTISGCYCTGSNVTSLINSGRNRRRLRNARRALREVGSTPVRNAISRIVRAAPGARSCNVPTHAEGSCNSQSDVQSCKFSCAHGFQADSRTNPTNCDTCPGGRIACGNACGFFSGCPTNAPARKRSTKRDRIYGSMDEFAEDGEYDNYYDIEDNYLDPIDVTDEDHDPLDDVDDIVPDDEDDDPFEVRQPEYQPPSVRQRFGCEPGHTACGVFGGSKRGFECIDTKTNLESCGGCAITLTADTARGRDCSAIVGVADVECSAGNCIIHSCNKGYKVSLDGTTCVRDPTKSTYSNITPLDPLGGTFALERNPFAVQG